MNSHSSRIPVIVILTPNTLMSVGLKSILEGMLPFVAFKICSDFEEIAHSEPEDYFHIFAASTIVVEHVAFFSDRKSKTIILTTGGANTSALGDFHHINIMQPQDQIERAIMSLHGNAHGSKNNHTDAAPAKDILSNREVEVLRLIVEGLINKEIAERLSISITTVITHRKNIFEKLGIKSVAGLTIYAVMKRYIEI